MTTRRSAYAPRPRHGGAAILPERPALSRAAALARRRARLSRRRRRRTTISRTSSSRTPCARRRRSKNWCWPARAATRWWPTRSTRRCSARRAATCAAALDEACAQAIDGVYRCLCIFALNGFGYLADGLTGGGIALYLTGSKFTHCCLRPNCHFHGQNGRLTFRSVRPIEAGEILTIDYLGPCGECAAPRRRKQLLAAKAFECACTECALPDTLRPPPCPRCAPRDAASGLRARPRRRRAGVRDARRQRRRRPWNGAAAVRALRRGALRRRGGCAVPRARRMGWRRVAAADGAGRAARVGDGAR